MHRFLVLGRVDTGVDPQLVALELEFISGLSTDERNYYQMTRRSLRDGFKNSKGRHSLVVMTKWRCLLSFVPPVPGHTTARGFSPDSVSDPILISPRPHRSSSTPLVVTRNIVIIATTNECLLLYLVFDTWPIFTARNRPFF